MATAVSAVSRIHGSTVRVTRSDITLLEVDAFVFYASHDLALGAGYGTAIATRGGAEIQRALRELAPVATCDVVVTGAGKLPASHIIHAVGPRFREPDLEGKLRRTMENVLARVSELGVRSVAFPPMGAGYYGIPAGVCAEVMLESLARHLSGGSPVEEVVIAVLDANQEAAFEAALELVTGRPS